jgi:hypothetical protein
VLLTNVLHTVATSERVPTCPPASIEASERTVAGFMCGKGDQNFSFVEVTGFIRLRVGSSGRLLREQQRTFGFRKRRAIC